MFDLTVNLGNLITIVSVAVGGIWFLANFRTDIQIIVQRLSQFDSELKNFDQRLAKMADGLDKLTEVLTRIARQEERLDGIDQRINESAARTAGSLLGIDERLRNVEKMAHHKSEPEPAQTVNRLPATRKRKRS